MDIQIKTSDYDLTAEVKQYLDERFAAVEKTISDKGVRCEVTLGRAVGSSKHGENWSVEATLIQAGAPALYAHAQAENVNEAIDKVKDEIIKQLRREKRIHIRMMRKGGALVKNILRRG